MSADPVSFSKAVLDLMWESADDIDNESIEALAVEHGLILWRKPTPAELSDDDWWGHEYSIGAMDEGVGEFTPSFQELLPNPVVIAAE